MRNLIIGLTFSLVSVFTIIMVVLTWRDGQLFYFKEVWSSFIGNISSYDWVTKESFDSLIDRFEYIRDFKFPSFSDGPIDAIKSVFNLLKNFIGILLDIIILLIAPLFDLGYVVGVFLSSFINGWSEPVVPLIL